MTVITSFADDIFFIVRRKPTPKLRQYKVTFPCGSTWEFDRSDLEVPQYIDGKQTGMTHCYATIKEAISDLTHTYKCKVEQIA